MTVLKHKNIKISQIFSAVIKILSLLFQFFEVNDALEERWRFLKKNNSCDKDEGVLHQPTYINLRQLFIFQILPISQEICASIKFQGGASVSPQQRKYSALYLPIPITIRLIHEIPTISGSPTFDKSQICSGDNGRVGRFNFVFVL